MKLIPNACLFHFISILFVFVSIERVEADNNDGEKIIFQLMKKDMSPLILTRDLNDQLI